MSLVESVAGAVGGVFQSVRELFVGRRGESGNVAGRRYADEEEGSNHHHSRHPAEKITPASFHAMKERLRELQLKKQAAEAEAEDHGSHGNQSETESAETIEEEHAEAVHDAEKLVEHAEKVVLPTVRPPVVVELSGSPHASPRAKINYAALAASARSTQEAATRSSAVRQEAVERIKELRKVEAEQASAAEKARKEEEDAEKKVLEAKLERQLELAEQERRKEERRLEAAEAALRDQSIIAELERQAEASRAAALIAEADLTATHNAAQDEVATLSALTASAEKLQAEAESKLIEEVKVERAHELGYGSFAAIKERLQASTLNRGNSAPVTKSEHRKVGGSRSGGGGGGGSSGGGRIGPYNAHSPETFARSHNRSPTLGVHGGEY